MSQAWIKALAFAALPGASKVRFERRFSNENGTPTTNYKLTSLTANGTPMGDDRDYDLLKAALGPLESLAEHEDHKDLIIELDLENSTLHHL
ncbi:MAG: hypothetical protein ACX94B_02335 [Henriciella sp.]